MVTINLTKEIEEMKNHIEKYTLIHKIKNANGQGFKVLNSIRVNGVLIH